MVKLCQAQGVDATRQDCPLLDGLLFELHTFNLCVYTVESFWMMVKGRSIL